MKKPHPFIKKVTWVPTGAPASFKFFDPLRAAHVTGGEWSPTTIVLMVREEDGGVWFMRRECVKFAPAQIFRRYRRMRVGKYERKVNAPIAEMKRWLNSLDLGS